MAKKLAETAQSLKEVISMETTNIPPEVIEIVKDESMWDYIRLLKRAKDSGVTVEQLESVLDVLIRMFKS